MLLNIFLILCFNRYEIEHINNPLCKQFEKDLESLSGSKIKIFTKKDYPNMGEDFYRECDVYDEIIIGEGITQIYDNMFYASTIKKITLNTNITTIGDGAFAYCTKLTTFDFNFTIKTIGDGAFYYSSLGSSTRNPIQISSYSITSIGESAFEGCPLIGSTVNLLNEDSQNKCIIKSRAFYGTQIISIKLNQIQKINEYAFSNCKNLKIIFNNTLNVDTIGRYSFYNCTKLDSCLSIYSNYIGECAFYQTKLTLNKIELKEIIRNNNNYNYNNNNGNDIQISNYAFSGLTVSNSLNFNLNSRILVLDYAFYNCTFRDSQDSINYINLSYVVVYPYSFACCNFVTKFVLLLNNVEIKYRGFELITGNLILKTNSSDFKTVFGEYSFQSSLVSLPKSHTLYINNEIKRNAFSNCSKIRGKLVINVREIARYAFYNCTNLVGPIHINNADIQQSAFEGCIAPIQGLIITSRSREINIFERAFYNSGINCPLTLNSFINQIHEYAFSNCFNLKNHLITIHANEISSYAFSDCGLLLKPVTIHSRFISIKSFHNTNFNSLTIKNSHQSPNQIVIGTNAFYSSRFNGVVTIEGNILIKPYAFIYSTFQNDVIINSSSIGSYAFCECKTGNSIKLSIGFTSILSHAFERFGDYKNEIMLDFCYKHRNNDKIIIDDSAFNESGLSGNIIIPDYYNLIGNYSFYNCKGIKSVEINFGDAIHYFTNPQSFYYNSNVRSIGESAFEGCSKMTKLVLNSNGGMKKIGKRAFYSLNIENELSLPSSLELIDDSAFENCTNLKKCIFNDNCQLKYINNNAFCNCNSLEGEIYIPKNIEIIGKSAFQNCFKLTKLALNFICSLTTIDDYAFCGCCNIKGSLNIPLSITKIGDFAFANCTSLGDYLSFNTRFNAKGCTIGNHAFEGCINIKQFYPNKDDNYQNIYKIESVGDYAFYNSGITGELFISNWHSIGKYAFKGCIFDRIVFYYDYNQLTIKEGAFEECTIKNDLVFPKSLIQLKAFSFRKAKLKSVKFSEQQNSLVIEESAFEKSKIKNCFYLPNCLSVINNCVFKNSKIGGFVINKKSILNKICESAFEGSIIKGDFCLPNSLIEIQNCSFKKSELDNILIDKESNLNTIGVSAFENANIKSNIFIPINVYMIKNCTFKNSTINGIIFDEKCKLNTIAEFAFEGSEITNSFNIPNSLISIKDCAFKNSKLGGILFSNKTNLVEIGISAFEMSTIGNIFYIPSKLKYLNNSIFKNCKLNGLYFDKESELISINESAFEGSNINGNFEFPKKLNIINKYAFKNSILGIVDFHEASNLEIIEMGAFQNSTISANLYFYSQIKIISIDAFKNCSQIGELIFFDRKALNLIIDNDAFCDSSVSGKLNIPVNAIKIGQNAFKNCINLIKLNFENSATNTHSNLEIGDHAFENSSIENELIFPNHLNQVGNYAFSSCQQLKGKITIINGEFGKFVFKDCINIIEIEMFGGSLGKNNFEGCKNFVGPIHLHETCTIQSNAFNGFQDSKFTLKLTDAKSITIGERAFYNSSLTGSLDFKSCLFNIGKESFSNCQFILDDLKISIHNNNVIELNAFMNSKFKGNLEYYASNEQILNNIFDYYLKGCSGFTNFKFGATEGSTIFIPSYKFYGMKEIKGKLTLAETISSVGKYAFAGCDIYQIDICDNNNEYRSDFAINEGAFSNCIKLNTTVNLRYLKGDEIQARIFSGCSNLPSIIFPSLIQKIGNEAFSGCSSLSFQLDFITNLKYIGKSAFYRCLSLRGSLEISHKTKYIGESAFYGCIGLSGSLTIHVLPSPKLNLANPTFIGPFAFKYCSGFKKGKLFIFIDKNEDQKNFDENYHQDRFFLTIGNEAFEGTKFNEVYYNGKYQPDCEYNIGLTHTSGIYTSSNYVNITFCNYPIKSNDNPKYLSKFIVVAIFIISVINLSVLYKNKIEGKKNSSDDSKNKND